MGNRYFFRAHVLVPHGFDKYPQARFPLSIFHSHCPSNFGGFSETPPDSKLICKYSQRFDLDCYNKFVAQESYDLYQYWVAQDIPRMLIAEIDHGIPYYDDSYAVNSDNLRPLWGFLSLLAKTSCREIISRHRRRLGKVSL